MRSYIVSAALMVAATAHAQGAPTIDKADTVWVLVCSILVLLMTPALALFYGGMVRRKNVLSTMMHSFILMGIGTLIWILLGYSLAFGHSTGYLGNLEFAFGNGISMTQPYGTQTIPAGAFMLFQMMFAVITPALISGALAERMRFSGYVVFTALWSILVYAPIACWVWNPDGWLCKMGALDFAGGTVVHIASGAAALAGCIALGPRRHAQPSPHNIPWVLLGGGLLWVGWIGFNAGSALAANDIAIGAFLATQIAAAAGLIGWLIAERIGHGKPTSIGAASGLVAGLVGITPAAGFVLPGPAILIGLIAGVVCYFGVRLKAKFKFDDALDVVGVHGVGGTIGAILTGVFASPLANSAVRDALAQGRGHLVLTQALAVFVVIAFSFTVSFVLMKFAAKVTGIRASVNAEAEGLDLTYHDETAYQFDTDLGEYLPMTGDRSQ